MITGAHVCQASRCLRDGGRGTRHLYDYMPSIEKPQDGCAVASAARAGSICRCTWWCVDTGTLR